MMETTDRKEMKDLVENGPIKDLQGSTRKRVGSVRLSNRKLGGFQKGNPSRALSEERDDLHQDRLVADVCKGRVYTMRTLVSIRDTIIASDLG